MKNLLTPARILLLLLLGCPGAALPQSLGTAVAEVWMGRPLELTVPARFAGGDTGECVHADVFFGENRVPADRVRATVIGSDQQKRVRIEANKVVDEPVVTVSVRAGCRNTITRNYTLLPEMPTETMVASLVARQQAALAGPVATAPLRMATGTERAAAPRRERPPTVQVAQARTGEAAAPRARSARAFRQEAAATGPRLRLEPIDMEQQATLRTSAQLADPDGDATRRATAALLWKAINADPQEILRTTAMLHKLEGDLAQLRQAAGQTRTEVADLRKRLDEVRQPWYLSAAAIQVLGLLVLATAAAAGMLWYRARRAANEPWYEMAAEPPLEAPDARPLQDAALSEEATAVAAPPRTAVPVVAVAPVIAARKTAPRAIDSHIDADHAIDFELPRAFTRPQDRRRPATHVLRVETLAATLEEVEFLSSLGLAQDAMDVLKAYLQDSAGPAPLAYFELMRLCHQHEDAAAVATVRRRYAHTYGMDAPRLEQLSAPLGLEGLPDLSARITAAWGTPRALDEIEEALFKVPQPGVAITLQAGRDLVCLHELAMRIATEAAPASAVETHALAPWAHAEDAGTAQAAAQAAADAQGGDRFALDVDLGVSPGTPPQQASEPGLTPLLEEMRAAAAREIAARAARAARKAQEEEAFNAAMASERVPVSRF